MPEQALGGIPLGFGIVVEKINLLNFHAKCAFVCSNPVVAARCMDEKRNVMSRLETKIEAGIER